MIFHPGGGDIEYLRTIITMGVVTHSIALVSMPVMAFGLLGLTLKLNDSNGIAIAAFVVISFGMIAAMIAAALNGLVLPSILERFGPGENAEEQIRLLITYNSMLNHAFDKILMTSFAAAVILWSIAILRQRLLPRWLGIFGGIDGLIGLYAVLSGALGVHLNEFRLFIFGFVAWNVMAGLLLWRVKEKKA